MRPRIRIFGKRVAQARKAIFVSQVDLGIAAGYREGRMGAIEQREVAGISPDRVPKLAKALRMSPDDFIAKFSVPDDFPLPSAYLAHELIVRGRSIDWLTSKTGFEAKLISRHVDGQKEPTSLERAKYAKAFGMAPEIFEQAWKTHKPAFRGFDDAIDEDEESASEDDPELVAATEKADALDDASLLKASQDKKTPGKIRAHYMRLLAKRIEEQN